MDATLFHSISEAIATFALSIWQWFFALQHIEYAPRVLVALALGFTIGLERRSRHKSVGVRTYMIIAGSSALITLCGYIMLLDREMGDPTRLAGQILAGIGFIGAGVILKRGFNSSGVTTAALILLAVGAGIGCGFGLLGITVAGTLMVLVCTLIAGSRFASKELAPPLIITFSNDATASDIIALFGKDARTGGFRRNSETTTVRVQPVLGPVEIDSLLQRLINHDQIISATVEDVE